MAEILGKDLDNYDESLAARQPFSLSESDTAEPKFMTGADLVRSAKISADWKDPIAIRTQAYTPVAKASQPVLSAGRSMVDSLVNLPSNIANLVAQGVLESTGRYEPAVDVVSILADKNKREKLRKAFEEDQESLDETIKLLSGRDYSVDKWARRVIANTTANVENRKLVRELYNQAQGIDSSKWYNEAGAIIGAMVPTMAVGNTAFATSRAFGAGRAAATKIATNVAKGYIGAEMAGQYAEETAAQYLQRTGDKNFENFTAKDASGLSAAAYGAIGAQIEFMGGVEPIMAGALTKVGLRSAGLKAAAKIGVGEATEELLQGLTETLFRKIEGTTDKTWKEGFEDSLKGAAWGLFIGGTMGTTAFYVNRRNLVKGIKTTLPNISDTEAQLVADAMIDNTAEMSSQDPILRNNLRNKVALMYRDVDVDNKDTIIDATTDLEYSLIAMDAIDRGIEITDHEIFQGEVNELGWFREGIPEAQRAEIKSINDNIVELKSQLEELNKAEKKDWAKIEETENKLAQASQYVLERVSDLATEFKKLEDRYVEKEKQKALDAFEATQEQKELANSSASLVFNTLSNEGVNVQKIDELKPTKHGAVYLQINPQGGKGFKIRLGVTPIGTLHKSVVANFNVATMTPEQILARIRNLIENKYPQTNKKAKGGVNIGFGEQPMFQEQFDIADENARLDDIYPEYKGETINIDGKERTVYNSNGERIAQSEPALRNFYKWFGDSKVVDEEGRPIVMYHGTSNTFDSFDPTTFGYATDSGFFGSGFYFTPIESEARYYGRIVMPVYLKIEKPFIVSTGGYYSGLYDNLFEGGGQLLKDLGLLAENDLKDFNKYERLKKEFLKNAKVEKIYTYDAKHNEVQVWRASFEKNGRSYESNSYRPWEEVGYNEKEDTKENALNNAWGEYAHFNDLNFLIQDLSFTDYIRTNGLAEELSNIIKSRGYDGTIAGDEHIVFEPSQIKSVDNRGTFSADTGNIYWQNRPSGAAPSTYRGAYIPEYRFILRANKMDASTLSHELAHDWMEANFDRYRSGKQSKDFMKAWGALEKALGIPENATSVPRKASEAFARAYEAWIVQNEDWTKFISVDNKDRDAVEKLMKDYQGELRDIYNDISNPYFKQTWGRLGELKPELKAWFDRVVNITDLDVMVERGEMTESQAANEKLNRAIDTVIENTTDEETKLALEEAKTLNDTARYEVEGGNQNSIQRRLSALAKEIDGNGMALKGDKYDSHRDMMQVAEVADNFVKTRLDDALAIINGQMAEVEGLYKEDLYTALERLAVENGDLGLIDELKNSEVANRLAKELGQRVAGFRNFKQSTDIDVVSALKSLDMKFNKALDNKKAKQEYDSALKLLDESLKHQDKIADKDLDNFLKDLECK